MTEETTPPVPEVTATAEQITITNPVNKLAREKEIIAELARLYPKAFFVDPKQRKPLMIGIKWQVHQALPGFSKKAIEKAFKFYCNDFHYLRSFECESHRVNENGEPTSEISLEDKENAKAKLTGIKTFLSKKTPKTIEKSDTIMAERETLILKRKSPPKTESAKPVTLPASTSDIVNASAKTAKITLVLATDSITRINSEGRKQVKLVVQVGEMKFTADLNSKSYRKALASIDELGAENCNAILQGSMPKFGQLEGVGLVIQPKKAKEVESIPTPES